MKKILFLFIFLSSCMVGPDYKKPNISMPLNYIEEEKKQDHITSLKNWWETFNDANLNDLINKAIAKNLDLKLSIERIEQARSFYRLQKANLFPEIDLTAAALRAGISQNSIASSIIKSPFNFFLTGFDASWEIDIFGKLRRQKESAFYEILSYQEAMRNVYITIISDAARYYVDICSVQNIIDLTRKKIELQNNILNLVENKKIHGLDSKINVNNELSILKQEEENLLFYSTVLKQTVYKLAVILGENPQEIDFDFNIFNTIPDAQNRIITALPSTLLRNRPDIKQAEKKLASATAIVGAAIAEYFPSFSLISFIGINATNLSNLFKQSSFTWTLGSIMNWPIITFGRIRANVDQKKSEQKQALITYENTILQALADVESSFVAYFNEDNKLKEIEKELEAVSENTFLINDRYKKGLNSQIDFFMQEKLLIDMKMKEILSRKTLCHNLIALYKALGGDDWSESN